MHLKEIILLGIVALAGIYLAVSGRVNIMGKPKEEARLLSLATDITDLPKTRLLKDVTNRIIEVRTQELADNYDLNAREIFIKTKTEPRLTKFLEHYTITFELDIRGVNGLYAERYTIRTTKKRMFNITDVKYDHKCTIGKVVQEWTIEPCAIKMGSWNG